MAAAAGVRMFHRDPGQDLDLSSSALRVFLSWVARDEFRFFATWAYVGPYETGESEEYGVFHGLAL